MTEIIVEKKSCVHKTECPVYFWRRFVGFSWGHDKHIWQYDHVDLKWILVLFLPSVCVCYEIKIHIKKPSYSTKMTYLGVFIMKTKYKKKTVKYILKRSKMVEH